MSPDDKAITLGHPSYVWRFGQDRRLALIRSYAPLEGQRILDVGCGLGTYVKKMRDFSQEVYGVDVDPEKVAEASRTLPNIQLAPAEKFPFPPRHFACTASAFALRNVASIPQAVAEMRRLSPLAVRSSCWRSPGPRCLSSTGPFSSTSTAWCPWSATG